MRKNEAFFLRILKKNNPKDTILYYHKSFDEYIGFSFCGVLNGPAMAASKNIKSKTKILYTYNSNRSMSNTLAPSKVFFINNTFVTFQREISKLNLVAPEKL